MNNYAPYDFHDINMAQAHGQPNDVYLNSAIFTYWCRNLFQRLTSVFEWTVPETWEGKPKDLFNYLLFRFGFCGVIDTKKYGVIFQPCSLGEGRNIFYQPSNFLVTNAWDSSIDGLYKCGIKQEGDEEDASGQMIFLTPDFTGVWDTVEFYASRLSFLYSAINTSLLVCRNPRILGARSRAGSQALKVVQDKIISGDPFAIIDTKVLYPDAKTKEDVLFDLSPTSAKENYITNMLLADEKTILKEFDSAVGIANLDSSDGKKERLVTSEAEAQLQNSTASAFVWFDCLKDSISKVKEVFPDLDLDVRLRYSGSMKEGGEIDVSNGDNAQGNRTVLE